MSNYGNELEGKVIVVTGGAGLLGRAFCKAIAAVGGITIVADINTANAAMVAEEIRISGGFAEGVHLDIGSVTSVCHLLEHLTNRYDRIDAVVNNAYPRNERYGQKLEDVQYKDFCANLSSHVGGYFLVAQQFSTYFRKKSGGNIVNMGSIYGGIAPRFQVYENTNMTMPVEYAAIKSGVAHLTRYFAQYYKKDGIRVNTLSPGGIIDAQPQAFLKKYTELSGKKGMLNTMDIVGPLIFLLSDASQFITGQEIVVDDGFSL